MATLTSDELARLKREVLDHVLDIGALPYVDFRYVYDIVRDHVVSSAVAPTTSTTAVTTTGATVLTVGTTTGLAAGTKVVLDADDARETVTVRAVLTAGTNGTLSVVCRKPHSGTYPVEVESALTLVRGALSDLAVMQDKINGAVDGAGLKSVDEVAWFSASENGGRTQLDELRRAQAALRLDLAKMCGLGAWLARARGAGGLEAY